jgi:iron(III) transport system ATP-binding protein
MVFQDGALFPHLTVTDNVAFGLRGSALKMSRRERAERVDEMLELVDLAGLGDRYPGTLSGGQQQRVALARSLAPQPSVLLLDEPFSALDAALRVQVRAEVARIVRDVSVTTIFVTHDQDEAFVLGDRVAVLRNGYIEQIGTPDDLYRHPSTRWVAGFVGEANIVRGRFDSTSGDTTSGDTKSGGTNLADTLLGPVPIDTSIAAGFDGDLDILVRPEQVELQPGDCALVTNVEYYGHDVRYELQLDDGSILAARTKSSQLHERGTRVCPRFDGPPTEAWPAAGPTDAAATLLTP